MSDKTESPALLSPERLAEIGRQLEEPRARNCYVTDYGVAADVVEELYDHVAAFRQMVATELAALLAPYADELDIEPIETLGLSPAEWKGYNATIRTLATRLGIEL